MIPFAVLANHPVARRLEPGRDHQRKAPYLPPHRHNASRRTRRSGMARQRDMGHIGPGVERKLKPAQRLPEPRMQVAQRRGYF